MTIPATSAEISHFLRRATFGATPTEVNAYVGMELGQLIDQLIDSVPAPVILPTLDPAMGDYQQLVVIRRWWLQRMADVAVPLREKLTFFWHGHFPSSYWKVPKPQLLLDQNQTLRAGATGPVGDLAKAIAVDPAMLVYLDNGLNVASAPNENFARELFELFTLGVDNHYTQADIVASARAWSGHGLVGDAYVFNASLHDGGDKTIFGVTKAFTGPDVIDELTGGANRAVMARFLAAKLWSFYAYPRPGTELLDQLASEFANVDMRTDLFLKVMFRRPEFYSAQARQSLVRSPVEWGVALLRATGVSAQDSGLDWALADLGQSPFEPPSVSGWKQNEYWISEAALWKKHTVASTIGWKANDRPAGTPPVLPGIETLPPGEAVQVALDLMGTPEVSAITRGALVQLVTHHAGYQGLRANLLRTIALTPEFQLA